MTRQRKNHIGLGLVALLVTNALASCRFSYEVLTDESDVSLGGQGGAANLPNLGDGDGDMSGDGDDTAADGGSSSGGSSSGGVSSGGTPSGGAPSGGMGGGGASAVGTGGEPIVIPDDWWDSTFRTRVRIDVDASALGAALTEFPVALRLSGGAYEEGKAGAAGAALRFVADDQSTELPFEIEDAGTLADSLIWIRTTTTGEPFWLYYDNAAASSGEQATSVWSNGFVAVYHLGESLLDSSSQGNNGTDNGTLAAAGQQVGGRDFTATSTPVDLGTPAALNNLFEGGATLSLWINPRTYGPSVYPRLMDKSLDTLAGGGWGLQLYNAGAGGHVHFEQDFSTTFGQWQTDCCQLAVPGWQSLTLSYDSSVTGNKPSIYLDGTSRTVNELSAPVGTLPDDSAIPLLIGERSGASDRPFDGTMDEIRISNVVRSPDWVKMEHLCMSSGCTTISNFVETLD